MGPLTEARICVELWVKEAEPSARWRQLRVAVGRGERGAMVGLVGVVWMLIDANSKLESEDGLEFFFWSRMW